MKKSTIIYITITTFLLLYLSFDMKYMRFDSFEETVKLSQNAPISAKKAKLMLDEYIAEVRNTKVKAYRFYYTKTMCFSKNEKYYFPAYPNPKHRTTYLNGFYVDSNSGEITESKDSAQSIKAPYGVLESEILLK